MTLVPVSMAHFLALSPSTGSASAMAAICLTTPGSVAVTGCGSFTAGGAGAVGVPGLGEDEVAVPVDAGEGL